MKFFLFQTPLPGLEQLPQGCTIQKEEVRNAQFINEGRVDARLKAGDELYILGTSVISLYTIIDTNPPPAVVQTPPPQASTSGSTPLDECGLSTKVANILMKGRSRKKKKHLPWHPIETVDDLSMRTAEELFMLWGFGRKAHNEVTALLAKRGASLKPSPELLSATIDVLGLSVRDANALRSINVCTIGDLTEKTDQEVFEAIVSRKTTDEIVAKIATRGLCLKK